MPGIRRRLFLASILAFAGTTATAGAHEASPSAAGSPTAQAATDGSLRPPALHPTSSEPSNGAESRARRDGGENAPRSTTTRGRRGDAYRLRDDRRINPAYGPRQKVSDEPPSLVWEAWFGASYRRHLEEDDDDDEVTEEAEANRMCSEYLVSFLEGSTDAKDTCEGIMNAYYAAGAYSVNFARLIAFGRRASIYSLCRARRTVAGSNHPAAFAPYLSDLFFLCTERHPFFLSCFQHTISIIPSALPGSSPL